MFIIEKIENEIKYFDFFKRVLKRGFKKRYIKNAPLKLVAVILLPIITMLLSTLIFSRLFSETTENYPLFFFCGEIVFLFLFGSAYFAMDSVKENFSYIKSVYMPKHLFVLSSVVLSAVPLILYMVLAVFIMLFTSAPFSLALLLLPLLAALIFMFAFGFSLILAAFKPVINKLGLFYLIFSVIWLILSPVFYPLDAIPEKIRFIFDINPAVHYMEIMRTICCQGAMPSESALINASVYSLLVMLLGISVFKSRENSFFQSSAFNEQKACKASRIHKERRSHSESKDVSRRL